MTDDNQISLPTYIQRSLLGAWKLVQVNPKAMDYLDISSDGFWKSFWAIAVMIPVFILKGINDSKSGLPQPIVSESLYVLTALPMTALVMYYFTRFMKISENYVPMVIAYNWLNALTVNIIIIAGLILNLIAPESQVSGIIQLMLGFYFGLYVVWFMFKTSLVISGMLAIGVVIFENLLNSTYQVILMKILDPEAFDFMFAAVNNQPS